MKEAGYIFVYLSYEDLSNNYVEFDDFKITHTKSNLIQANEYYPFGLQTANSWTRENTTGNNFLGNGGTELNTTSILYDLEYRNYDPALARMHQVDPMTDKYASFTPYNYSFNSPAMFNDPSGADPDYVTRRGVNNPGGVYVSNNFGSNLFRSNNNAPGQWGPNTNSLSYQSFANADAYFDQKNTSSDVAWALGLLYGSSNVSVNSGVATAFTYSGESEYSNFGNMRGGITADVATIGIPLTAASETHNQGCPECGFHYNINVETSITAGWWNFAAEVKDVVGGELKIGATKLYEASASTVYKPSKYVSGESNESRKVTKVGAYVLPLYGFGSTYSKNDVIDKNGNVSTTEQFNVGIGAFGIQINFDGLGVKDVRVGLDAGISLALGIGFDLSYQQGLIYVNH